MELSQEILSNISQPTKLEALYRKDPIAFKAALDTAIQQNPDSIALQVWNLRLNFSESEPAKDTWKITPEMRIALWMALAAGLITRMVVYFVDLKLAGPINLLLGIAPFIAGYFILQNKAGRFQLLAMGLLYLTITIFINTLPLKMNDIIFLANIHVPILLWLLVGLAFSGAAFRQTNIRVSFLKLNGEFVIIYAIMAMSGIVLTIVTNQLFSLVHLDIMDLYLQNIIAPGAAILAVAAIYLTSTNLNLAKHVAPYIAKIFSPVVLVTLIAYLIAVLVMGSNPFMDRDFLLSFNLVLIGVLIVAIFSITEMEEKSTKNVFDWILLFLLSLAILTDTVALAAIIFRLGSYGLTPNRLAVLGVNTVMLFHLGWIDHNLAKFMLGKIDRQPILAAMTQYLPIYGAWAIVVIFLFPLLFP